jgi:ATP-binding protein involved in chromosome partitioning
MSASESHRLVPLALSKDGPDRLIIDWSDGHRGVYTWRHLRDNCPCAGCREERDKPPDPFRILKPNELVPLAPVRMPAVGRYAYKIVWSDGHDSGIYTLEHLRSLCQCPQCAKGERPPGGSPQKISLPNVHNVIAVASGKGGVGKSTVAANLALALAGSTPRVGLLDADIYGPSVPIMMGVRDVIDQRATPLPLQRYGLKLMSMGFLVPPAQAVIWRGPMVHRALVQFLTDLDWGALDYLVIDLPPGTGDAQLTLTQTAPLSGAIIVTTPQDVALIDARKGLEMFRQVRVPVLGIVENMSYYQGDDGKRVALFGHGGGQKLATEASVPFLGEIPIDPRVAVCGDEGEPIVHRHPDSGVAQAYRALAASVIEQLGRIDKGPQLPEVQL